MKIIKIILKLFGYSLLGVIIFGQILLILSATSLIERLTRAVFILAVGMYFAIKWQKKNRKEDN
jgi:hypothetical protein